MKLSLICTALAAICFATPSLAGGHYVVYPIVKVVVPKASTPVAHAHHHHHGGKFFCFNPGGFIVCATAIAIIVDEVKRVVDGPACATNKMTHKSYFGMARDEPRLWRPLCNWPNPQTASVGYFKGK